MKSIDYKNWAEYIIDVAKTYGIETKNVLELGSGNCLLSERISGNFDNIFLSDNSFFMLNSNSIQLDKVCCDMTLLPFKTKFDFIFSTFDSINYLTEEELLKKLFSEIKNVLSKKGIFTFDVSLEVNSINNLKHLNRKGKYEGVKYIQKSYYNKDEKIHYNFFEIILESGEKIEEIHKQRIYDFEDYFKVIYDSGLMVKDCFDAFTFNDAKSSCERVQFVVKHK
ncbi:MAG: class I SAM-dependent methyltransferase [Ignavibacteria bacterium]|jgi:SAM-dependent methyltransferase